MEEVMEKEVVLKRGEVLQELKQAIEKALTVKYGSVRKLIDDDKKFKKAYLVHQLKAVLKAVVGNSFYCQTKKEFSVIFDDGKSKVKISMDDETDAPKSVVNAGEFTLNGPVASSSLLFKRASTYFECWGAKTFDVITDTSLATLEKFLDIIKKTIEI
jgi:hypothetical protein